MKICAYVQTAYAKKTYKNESFDTRLFVGLRIVVNELKKAGYEVDYAGEATVHEYDVVLVSLTAQCDWYSFAAERMRWKKGNYKVAIGGAGVLNVEPWLEFFDVAMIGRGEDLIVPVVEALLCGDKYHHKSVLYAEDFSEDGYWEINQTNTSYPDGIQLHKGDPWIEGKIGCNHRCLFCSYTWSRKQNFEGAFSWDMKGGTLDMSERECALLDYESGEYKVNWRLIRTTAIDGWSERLRFLVGKKIRNETIVKFLHDAFNSGEKPKLIRLFNIIGYPTETVEDWFDLVETFKRADYNKKVYDFDGTWQISIQNNHFLPYPATPLACAPMQLKNFRGIVQKEMGINLPKCRLYDGKNIILSVSETIEALPTILLNAISLRGTAGEAEAIKKLCTSKKFWNSDTKTRQLTLEKYFDLNKICGAFEPERLPTRWLHTWANVEKIYGKTPLEKKYFEEITSGEVYGK